MSWLGLPVVASVVADVAESAPDGLVPLVSGGGIVGGLAFAYALVRQWGADRQGSRLLETMTAERDRMAREVQAAEAAVERLRDEACAVHEELAEARAWLAAARAGVPLELLAVAVMDAHLDAAPHAVATAP